ncbi:MAG TPA: hypothetical protein VH744_01890, partial [Terriglobales bacterium]
MKDPNGSQSTWAGRAVLVVFLLPVLSAYASGRKSQSWALAQFENAERMREALSERPSQERTRREFQQAISAYRSVYFGLPTSTRAAASAFRVAELLLEMGRQFDDKKALEAALRQYQFLRREYPGSSLRMEALFTIGEIYKDDLGDGEQA